MNFPANMGLIPAGWAEAADQRKVDEGEEAGREASHTYAGILCNHPLSSVNAMS